MDFDSKQVQEVNAHAVGLEIAQWLSLWWKAVHDLKRRVSFAIILLIIELVGVPSRWDILLQLALFSVLIWFMSPAVKVMIARGKRPLCTVLWVRRFHRGSRSRSLSRLWVNGVAPWGQLITLVDEDIYRPASTKLLIWMPVALLPEIFAFRKEIGPHILQAGILFTAIVLLTTLTALFLTTKRSVTSIQTAKQVNRVLRQTERIRKEKIFLWSGGLGVITCPRSDDQLWRETIRTLAPKVGAVIIDYGSLPTENVEWEINTLIASCGANKLVLALSKEAEYSTYNTPLDRDDFTRHLLLNTFAESQIIYYPKRVPLIAITSHSEAIVRPVQQKIGVATLS